MTNMVKMTFQINKQTIERDVPDFDWDRFRNMPSARAFARKSYFKAVQRIIREIEEGKNQTSDANLDTMEAVIGRSLFYTRQQINDWFEKKDWGRCEFKTDFATAKMKLKGVILQLASEKESPFSGKYRERLEKWIGDVADYSDEIANYLVDKLTVQPKPVQLADLGL